MRTIKQFFAFWLIRLIWAIQNLKKHKMKKTILILLLAASFLTSKSQEAEQSKVTYTVKEEKAEYFLNGKSVMVVEKGEITQIDASLNARSIKNCVLDKWMACVNSLWCSCDPSDDISYHACDLGFLAECIKESRGATVVN